MASSCQSLQLLQRRPLSVSDLGSSVPFLGLLSSLAPNLAILLMALARLAAASGLSLPSASILLLCLTVEVDASDSEPLLLLLLKIILSESSHQAELSGQNSA